MTELVEFRGAEIPLKEKNVLLEIEQNLRINDFYQAENNLISKFKLFNNHEETLSLGFAVKNYHVTIILIDDWQITALPESIKALKYLEQIHLSYNSLETIPKSIGELKNLDILDIRHNEIKILPESLGKLGKLSYLNLGANKIRRLPNSLENLNNLEVLIISGNPLYSFPDFITTISSLKFLQIAGCDLMNIPESIGNLRILEELDISYNDIEALPDKIGPLSNLKELDIIETEIINLPKSFSNLLNLRGFRARKKVFKRNPIVKQLGLESNRSLTFLLIFYLIGAMFIFMALFPLFLNINDLRFIGLLVGGPIFIICGWTIRYQVNNDVYYSKDLEGA